MTKDLDARQAAADAFAVQIGAAPIPHELSDLYSSSNEARMLACLAEVYERFSEAAVIAFHDKPEARHPALVAFRDGVNALQQLVEEASQARRAWVLVYYQRRVPRSGE